MRRAEIKVCSVLDIVKQDYVDNNQKSLATLLNHINNHLLPFFGERSAERIRSHDIEEYKKLRNSEGAAKSSINLELATLRRAYNLAIRKEIIKNKPSIVFYRVGNSNRRTGFFEKSDYDRMLAVLRSDQKQIFRFAYLSGWRQSEILGLRWDKNYDGSCLRIYESKNGKGRVLPLMEELATIIEQQKDNGSAYIFPFEGRKYNRATFSLHWRQAKQASGIDRHFHDLRRTAVRNLTRAGVPRVIAKEITGHLSDTVYDRYDIVDEQDIRGAMSSVMSHLRDKSHAYENTSQGPDIVEDRREEIRSFDSSTARSSIISKFLTKQNLMRFITRLATIPVKRKRKED